MTDPMPSYVRERVRDVIVVVIALLVVCGLLGVGLLILRVVGTAHAEGPSEKWGHDPATSQWFKNLHSPSGFPCCDYADGTRIEDPDYKENDDGSYDVFARETWTHIDKDHVVEGTNRVGYAILWWGKNAEKPYCFLPGARG